MPVILWLLGVPLGVILLFMLVFGIIGLVYKYQAVAPDITATLNQKSFILPMAVLVPMLVGLLFQQQMYPEEATSSSSSSGSGSGAKKRD